MQRSKCKNANPKKVETRGFSRCANPGFGFGKMSGLSGYPGFSKPGFQSLTSTRRFSPEITIPKMNYFGPAGFEAVQLCNKQTWLLGKQCALHDLEKTVKC